MKIFITKYKSPDGRVPNYFQVPRIVYLDNITINETDIISNAFGDYNDEILGSETPLSFTASDYDINLCLIAGTRSNQGKTISEFFDPSTNLNIPVGFKVAFGESETNIERGDFIDVESVKTNWRKDDSGWILSFNVIGAEEEYIKRAETLAAQPLDGIYIHDYRSMINELLSNNLVFDNLILSNGIDFRFVNAFGAMNRPLIQPYLFNTGLNALSTRDRWAVFLAFARDHGIVYKVTHSNSINPNASDLEKFTFRFFFMSDIPQSPRVPKILHGEDYFIRNTYQLAKQHLAIYYVSYTSPNLPRFDWLGCLYMNNKETTIGYTNIDGGGLVVGNQTNNIFKDYNLGKFIIRNNVGINEDEMIRPGATRGGLGTYGGVNIGVSIGRSLVRWNSNSNSGFNQIVALTAAREYRYLISGVKQEIDIPVDYEKGNPYKLFTPISVRDKNWMVQKVTGRKTFDSKCRLRGIEY